MWSTAYSMVPNATASATLPAIRTTKTSPKVWSKTSSGPTRLSEHERIIALLKLRILEIAVVRTKLNGFREWEDSKNRLAPEKTPHKIIRPVVNSFSKVKS